MPMDETEHRARMPSAIQQPEPLPFGWFEPLMPQPGGSLVERFRKGSQKPLGWSRFAFPLIAPTEPATPGATVPLGVLQAAYHALRSYQHGNGTPALAERVADHIKAALPEGSIDG